VRMFIFDFMEINECYLDKFKDNLFWGLSDSHPWVKRSATKAFKKYGEKLRDTFKNKIDRVLYPGLFDLIIEAENIGFNTNKYIEKYFFSKNEIDSLNKYKFK
ncbi:caspase family protein, partial [bacterium]|nr:caspase family protein [bacterium]